MGIGHGHHHHHDPSQESPADAAHLLDTSIADSDLSPADVSRRGVLRSAGIIGAGVAAAGVLGAGSAAAHDGDDGDDKKTGDDAPFAGSRNDDADYLWLAGDHHIHTQYSPDGQYRVIDHVKHGNALGLGWMVITDHGSAQHAKIGVEKVNPDIRAAREVVNGT